jgi:hypothetical protein
MNFHFLRNTVFACVIIAVSVYAPLRAMEDSTLVVPKTTSRPFWIWQNMAKIQATGFDADFNRQVLQIQNDDPTSRGLGFVISPLNIMWNHNNDWC